MHHGKVSKVGSFTAASFAGRVPDHPASRHENMPLPKTSLSVHGKPRLLPESHPGAWTSASFTDPGILHEPLSQFRRGPLPLPSFPRCPSPLRWLLSRSASNLKLRLRVMLSRMCFLRISCQIHAGYNDWYAAQIPPPPSDFLSPGPLNIDLTAGPSSARQR